MLSGIDDLLAAWRTAPQVASTLSLCEALSELGERRGSLVGEARDAAIEIGREAGTRFADNAGVLLAIGRMYLAAGELVPEAQNIVVRGARLAPTDPRAFRLLGETLLRRGDAVRAAKAFERALDAGMSDATTKVWHDRARVYAVIQETRGAEAVIEELERALAARGSERPAAPEKAVPAVVSAAAGQRPETLRGIPRPAGVASYLPRTATLMGMPPVNPATLRRRDSIPDDDDALTRVKSGDTPVPPSAPVATEPMPTVPRPDALADTLVAGPAGAAPPADPAARVPDLSEDDQATRVTSMQRIIASVQRAGMPEPREQSYKPPASRPSRMRDSDPTLRREPAVSEADWDVATRVLDRPNQLAPDQPPADRPPQSTIADPDSNIETKVLPTLPPETPVPAPPAPASSAEVVDDSTITLQVGPSPFAGIPVPPRPRAPPVRSDVIALGPQAAPDPRRSRDVISITSEAELLDDDDDDDDDDGDAQTTPLIDVGVLARTMPLPAYSPVPRPREEQAVEVDLDDEDDASTHDEKRPELVSLVSDSDMVSAERVAQMRGASTRVDVPSAPKGPPMSKSELLEEFTRSELHVPGQRLGTAPPAPAAGRAPAAAAPPAAPAAPATFSRPPTPAEAAATYLVPARPSRKRHVLPWLVVAVVLGVASGGVWYERERRHAAGAREAQALAERSEAQLLGGGKGLADADATLKRARELAPDAPRVAAAEVRVLALRVIDDGASALPALAQALGRARSLGVPDEGLAAGAVAAALGNNDRNRAAEIVAKRDGVAGRSPDALYELAAGAVLDARGDTAGAAARYRRAVEVAPGLYAAEVRLIRALLLSGDLEGGASRVAALADRGQGRPEPAVLTALAKVLAPTATRVPAPIAPTAVADLPRSLRSIGWSLIVPARGESRDAGAGLTAAVDDADTPAVAVLCGTLAMQAGDGEAATRAVSVALSMAPGYSAALALGARLALYEGRIDEAQKQIELLPPDARATVGDVLAYEGGDAAALTAPAAAGRSGALRKVLLARVLGARPVEPSAIDALGAEPWAELLAVDAALDAGDLQRAHEITARWEDAAKHPVRALRVARLHRYEGELEQARAALARAVALRPTAFERALLDAEVKEERERGMAALDDKLEPERKWLAAYIKARQGFGSIARRSLAKLKDPAPDAPRSHRLAAALALGEVGDRPRGEPLIRPLLAAFPKNPDVVRAAVGIGLLPPKALTRKK